MQRSIPIFFQNHPGESRGPCSNCIFKCLMVFHALGSRLSLGWFKRGLFFLLSCFLWTGPVAAADFAAWVANIKAEAIDKGISPEIVEQAFQGLKAPAEKVITLDRKQPEFTTTLDSYLLKRVLPNILKGKKKFETFKETLVPISEKYKVQPQYILALWGIETNYGAQVGKFPVIHALATLAFDGRREKFFKEELFHALRILNEGHVLLENMKGSWAGAMGQTQFMPSSYWSHAVNHEGTGSPNIWNSIPDVMASIANYLRNSGWQEGQPWGYPVHLPKNFDATLVGLETEKNVPAWSALKVKLLNGKKLPVTNDLGSIIILDQDKKVNSAGKAFLVFNNFKVILKWNKSFLFAVAVGMLADQLKEEN